MEKNYSRRKPATGRSDRPARSARPFRGEKSASSDKPARRYTRRSSEEGEEKSYTKKTYDRKPAGRKPYGERSDESRPNGRKPYERKSSDRKPYGNRTDEKKTYEKKSYDKKPYEKKSYDKKSYDKKPSYDRKPAAKPASKPAATKAVRPEEQEFVRLNKFIANSGICSRREADEFIQTGLVTVNGERVTELGRKVRYDDDVRFNGERIKGETKVYLVMNKPKDYVTTLTDPHAEKTVMDLISPTRCPQRIYPVGRLDKATTGVLMFTNDGELTEKLTHPAYGARKIYHVFLDSNLKKADFDQILEGINLEDGEIHADSLSYVDDDLAQVGIEIHSGRNRIVRRIFEHFGYKVKKLDRVYFAGLTKKAIKRGEWRFLTEQEVAKLKMGSFE